MGNKCDMDDKRVITTEQGQKLAAEYGVSFMETSAKVRSVPSTSKKKRKRRKKKEQSTRVEI